MNFKQQVMNNSYYLKLKVVLIALFFSLAVQAQQNISTNTIALPTDSLLEEDSDDYQANLDSMLHLWYVETAIKAESAEYAASLRDTTTYLALPDSVYRKRLANIASPIEMVFTQKVKQRIELYTIKWRKYVQTLIGVSQYYFPLFEEILDKYELPHELKCLPIVESALNPRATSRAGATGIWQFMYATGKIYDLKINSYIDERRDPIRATEAAAKYLKKLHSIYGDWALALAAYNCGPGNVNRAIKRSGGKTTYWEIYNFLPRETRNYVPSFIAANYLMAYYQDHKITPRPAEYPILTDTVKIQKTLHLQQVAEVLGMPIDQIRDLNPQFRRDIVPYSEDPFTLRLPVEQALRFAEKEAQIYNYKDSIFFKQNYSHTNQAIVAQYDEPDTKGKTRINYAIRSGDNLGSIARKYGVNIRDIRLWNNIHKNSIRVGKKIAIYLSESQAQAARSSKQKQNAVQSASVDEAPSYAAQASVSKEPGYVYYQIRNGENLWVISKKFPGISDKDLMAINRFNRADVRNLKGGQWIKIKKSI